ncbi:magnesium transporter [Mycetocola sp. CAN_C7]|uniref:magnesium and cobalt transport protein CorA n=1 Tax=Mycetocola sp. CAN_C7 TaxID=2787724 RepID=UPI0018C9F18A
MVVVDNAVYVRGERVATPPSLDDTYEVLHEKKGMAWIGLYRPDADELHSVAAEFGLHDLMIEDALRGHQRPKLERYGDTLFGVFKAARYLDAEERLEFGEVHVVLGPDFAITVRHSETPDIGAIRRRLEGDSRLLSLGPEAVLYAVLDEIVDGYQPVIDGLENDIDEIDDALFAEGRESSKRIYALSREVIEFQRATKPLIGIFESLASGSDKYDVDVELRRYLRDVHDHVLRVVERADAFRAVLQNALTVNSALVGQRQNEETRRLSEASFAQSEQVKKISSWAAILFAPTLIGTVYGMNFRFMPELDWPLGYPFALILMFGMGVVLFLVFKKNKWL